MPKDRAYHESAVEYNRRLAECAEGMIDDMSHEVVRKWPIAVAKQHRFHERRHQASLDKLLAAEATPEPETEKVDLHSGVSEEPIATVEVPVEETVPETAEIIEEAPPEGTLEDGCVQYHNPSNPSCAFAPEVKNG